MTTFPLTKLIIINNYHIQDNIERYSFEELTKYFTKKEFILSKQMENPYILIFEDSSIKQNAKSTHIHLGLDDKVIRVIYYISNVD